MMRPLLPILLVVAACAVSKTTAPEAPRGILFISGASGSDTAGSLRSQALVVEIHDYDGARVPRGTQVYFSTRDATVQYDGTFIVSLLTATDGEGRVSLPVRLGTTAGTGSIVVTVPSFRFVDSATYAITPGQPSLVIVVPADTAVAVGRSIVYRGGVTDQYGNARQDPVTWSVAQGASVTSAGEFVGTAVGRYAVTATTTVGGQSRSGAGMVSAVPVARIAAWRANHIVLMNLDGSNVHDLVEVADGGIGASIQWMPDRASVVYSTLAGGRQVLMVSDTLGVTRRFFASPPANVVHEAEPRVTRDGAWLVFAGYDTLQCGTYCLYRARTDASAPELLSPGVASVNPVWGPSPDGSRIATGVGLSVRVFDVGTRTLSSWSLAAIAPAWSPDGTRIAAVQANAIVVVAPDGSPIRTVTTSPRNTVPRMVWLPDSRYVLARDADQIFDLIDTVTGTEMRLPFTMPIGAISVR